MEDNSINPTHSYDKKERKRDRKRRRKSEEENPPDKLAKHSPSIEVNTIDGVISSSEAKDANRASSSSQIKHSSKNSAQSSSSVWNFEVDYNDHFETPLVAYQDIQPALAELCSHFAKLPKDLVIYDPYYCQGSIRERMRSIGYDTVINQNRDFYHDIKHRKLPEYDVLVTNPPYSGEHKVRLLQYLQTCAQPFLLLLPAYIATKAYWKCFVQSKNLKIVYIAPPEYYHYQHPDGTGKALPPFYSLWLVGNMPSDVLPRVVAALQSYGKTRPPSTSNVVLPGLKALPIRRLTVCRSIPELVRLNIVKEDKRPNPKQRKKLKQQMRQKA